MNQNLKQENKLMINKTIHEISTLVSPTKNSCTFGSSRKSIQHFGPINHLNYTKDRSLK